MEMEAQKIEQILANERKKNQQKIEVLEETL